MRVIETEYRGCRFRSRAEARWAVFLDTLLIPWTYELEGFDLDGTCYLPDFWVQGWDAWLEVKGPKPSPAAADKCRRLAEASGKRVLLVSGEPWLDGEQPLYDVMLFTHPEDARHRSSGWTFGEGRRNAREIWLVSDEYGAFTLNGVPHERDDAYPLAGDFAYQVVEALRAARGARFEHGESGAG